TAASTETTAASTETTAASTETTAAPSGDVTTIDFWIGFTDTRLDWTKEKAAAFNEKHPEYNIQITGFKAYNDVWDATVLAVDSGQPPALIHFFEAATRQALDAVGPDGSPYFKSVTDATAGRTEILGEPVILDSVISAARNYYTVNGSFYSMPWNTSSTVMFSNMEMLNAAGITEPPETWADVTAACDAIAAIDNAPSSCITWPNHSWFVEQSVAQQGELLANNDNGRGARATEVYLESAGMLAYLEWWKGLSDAGHYLYTGVQRDWDGTTAAFYAGDVAMLIYSSSDTSLITNTGNESGMDFQASFMPRNGDVDYVGNLIGGATVWMLSGLDPATEDGALAFLNFMSNPENAAAWHQLTGYEAITTDAIDLLESEGFFDENPNNQVASAQLAAAAATPAAAGALLGNFVGIRDVITIAIEDILVNDLDVATRMADAQAEAQKSLDEYEALFGG
ncbi:MAG: extracellular solute-binding protein, partial [Actinomycetota bacterium]|nr:extracellular solute-binding protein [Actinomycetota bacterium]